MDHQQSILSLQRELEQLLKLSKTKLPSKSLRNDTISRINSIATYLVKKPSDELSNKSILTIFTLCADVLSGFKDEYTQSVKILLTLLDDLLVKGNKDISQKCLFTIHEMLFSAYGGKPIDRTSSDLPHLLDNIAYTDLAFKKDTDHTIIKYLSWAFYFISEGLRNADTSIIPSIIELTDFDTSFFFWIRMTPIKILEPFMGRIIHAFRNCASSSSTDLQNIQFLIRCFVCSAIQTPNNQKLMTTILHNFQEKAPLLDHSELNTIRKEAYLAKNIFRREAFLLKQVQLLESTFNLHTPQPELNEDALVDLPKRLDNLQLSDYARVSAFLDKCQNEELIEQFAFRKGLYKVLKSISFSDVSSQTLVLSILAYIERISLKKSCLSITGLLHILDYITIEIKDLTPIDNEPFLDSCLQHLLHIFERRQQFKRMSNLSSLYYNYALLLYRQSRQTCVGFWNKCLEMETDMRDHFHQDTFDQFLNKAIRICNFLLEMSRFDEALKILTVCCSNGFRESNKSIEGLFMQLREKMKNQIKLACKLIMKSQNVKYLWALSEDEPLVMFIALEVCSMLTQILEQKSQPLISKIILMLKSNLKDVGLFLLFTSKIAFIIKFSITFRSMGDLKISKESSAYDLRCVIKAHLYLLQAYSSPRSLEKSLFNAYRCIASKEYKTGFTPCDYEVDVLVTMVRVFEYHNLVRFMITPLQKYIKEYKLTKSQHQILSFELSHCYYRLKLKNHIYSLNIKIGDDPYSKLMWAFHQSMIIEINNLILTPHKKIEQSYDSLLELIANDNVFTFKGKKSSSFIIELIFLLSHISRLHGLLSSSYGSASDAVLSFKRSIKILQTILKNFMLPNSPLTLTLNQKMVTTCEYSMRSIESYHSLLQCLFNYGLGKEIDYFMKEYCSFIETQPSKYVHCRCLANLAVFEALRGQNKEAADCLETATLEFKSITFIGEGMLDILKSEQIVYLLAKSTKELSEVINHYDTAMHALLKNNDTSLQLSNNSGQDKQLYVQDQEYLLSEWSCFQRVKAFKGIEMDVNVILSKDSITKWQYQLQNIYDDIQEKTGSQILEFLIAYPLFCPLSSTRCNLFSSHVNTIIECINSSDNILTYSQTCLLEREVIKEKLATIFHCLSPFQKKSDLLTLYQSLSSFYDHDRFESFAIQKELACQIENPKAVLPPKSIDTDIRMQSLSKAEKLHSLLPSNWAVISIDTFNSRDALTLTKYTSQNLTPVVLNIPLAKTDVGSKNEFSVRDAVLDFENIITKSDNTTSSRVTSLIKTKQDRIAWWTARRSLDTQLETLLRKIEVVWFGGLASLFGDFVFEKGVVELFKTRFIGVFADFFAGIYSGGSIIEKLQSIDLGTFSLFLQLAVSPQDNYMEDLLFYILDAITSLGRVFDYRQLDLDALYRDVVSVCEKAVTEINLDSLKHIEHTVLILSDGCVKLPWESIPSLRGKSISRMPSITQLVEYLMNFHTLLSDGVSADNGYFVLNPGGDLVKTESRFKDKFEVMSGWSGIIGKRPSEEMILKALNEKELYFYAGHGGGEQYVRSRSIQKFETLPPCLLMGCSSGCLHVSGICHSFGTVYNYIIGRSPMILANLWDVTDKDIDRFTLNTLEKWGLFVDYDSIDIFDEPDDAGDHNPTLCDCVAKSRNSCKLKYLNGAAPVVYGLPLKLKSNS